MTETIDLTKWLARVAALLAKAESTTHEEEADALRAKAQELINKYKLAEEDLLAQDPAAIKIINEMWVISNRWSRFRYDYMSLMELVAQHNDVKIKFVTLRAEDATAVRAVGYEVDVRLAMMMWNAVAEAHQTRIDVRYDAAVPEREMIYRLRSSGIERQKVARMMWGEEEGCKASAHAKVGKIYKEECAARGEEAVLSGKGIDLATFRKAYAESFYYRFAARLRRSRDAAGESGGLVFAGRKERVQEEFWNLFPEERPAAPSTDIDVREGVPLQGSGSQDIERECQACKKTTSKTGKCPMHRPYVETKAQKAAWERQSYGAAARAGRVAGAQAAEAVELDGVKRAARLAG